MPVNSSNTDDRVLTQLLGDALPTAQQRPTRWRPSPVWTVISLAILAAILIWGLPWATDVHWGAVATAARSLPLWVFPMAVGLGLLALVLEAFCLRLATPAAPLPRVLHAHAVSAGAASALPSGGLLGMGLMAWLLRRAGMTASGIVLGVCLAGIAETIVSTVLVPVFGLIAYAASSFLGLGTISLPGGIWSVLAAAGLGMLSLVILAALLSPGVMDKILSAIDDGSAEAASSIPVLRALRGKLVAALRSRGPAMVALLLLARFAQAVVLILGLRSLGIDLPVLLILVIFALARTVALLPLTPGGVGLTEAAGAAALVALGVTAAPATTAMLVLTIATTIVPHVAGGLASAVTPPVIERSTAPDAA